MNGTQEDKNHNAIEYFGSQSQSFICCAYRHTPRRAEDTRFFLVEDMDTTPSNDREQLSLQEGINAKLVQSGERERLKQLLRERLVECGWRDELKEQCKRIVKERGFENITTEELADEIIPVGRATVPDAVKAEIMHNIRKFLDA
jgi:enhancer of yellow 2 transcription factor